MLAARRMHVEKSKDFIVITAKTGIYGYNVIEAKYSKELENLKLLLF